MCISKNYLYYGLSIYRYYEKMVCRWYIRIPSTRPCLLLNSNGTFINTTSLSVGCIYAPSTHSKYDVKNEVSTDNPKADVDDNRKRKRVRITHTCIRVE